jgi:hypothetical protein
VADGSRQVKGFACCKPTGKEAVNRDYPKAFDYKELLESEQYFVFGIDTIARLQENNERIPVCASCPKYVLAVWGEKKL